MQEQQEIMPVDVAALSDLDSFNLTEMQKRFVIHYVVSGNGTDAARKAGSKAKQLSVAGSEILALPKIQEAIQAEKRARLAQFDVTESKVRIEMAKIAFLDVSRMLEINPDDGTATLDLRKATAVELSAIKEFSSETSGLDRKGVKNKVKFYDKMAALEWLARDLGMTSDKLEVSGPGGGAIRLEVEEGSAMARRLSFLQHLGQVVDAEPAPEESA